MPRRGGPAKSPAKGASTKAKAKAKSKRFVNLLGERENLPKFKIPAWMGRKELRMLLETEESDDEE